VKKTMLILVFLSFTVLLLSSHDKRYQMKKSYLNFQIEKIIGVDVPENESDKNYLFYNIGSVDCDRKGNIYVLDRLGYCVRVFDKYGKFVKRLFKKGKGPNEISAPQEIKINKFNNNIYILQDYGFTIKEFDRNGNFIKIFNLPEQFFNYFDFISENKVIYVSSLPVSKKNYYFKIVNLKTERVEESLVPITYSPSLNTDLLFFIKNDLIWSVPKKDFYVIAYSIKTGEERRRIKIKGNFKKNEIVRSGVALIKFIYNSAVPFFVNNKLYLIVTIRKYNGKTLASIKNPLSIKNYLYIQQGNEFKKLLYLKNLDFGEVKCINGRKLYFGFNIPYPHLKIVKIN